MKQCLAGTDLSTASCSPHMIAKSPHMIAKRLHIVRSLPEDLHGWLGVGVVGGLEAQLFEPQPVKKHFEGADEVLQG